MSERWMGTLNRPAWDSADFWESIPPLPSSGDNPSHKSAVDPAHAAKASL